MGAIDYPGFEALDELVIWRYMSVDRLRDLVAGKLYFPAARQFDDPFEGSIPDADSAGVTAAMGLTVDVPGARISVGAFEELRRLVKISCWHASPHENVAMWERYCRRSGGKVAVATTVSALKRSLHEFRLRPDYGAESIRVGRVHYVDYATGRHQHRAMEDRFMYKRIEFRDENEIRAIVSLRMAEEFGVAVPTQGIEVGVDAELINEVRVWGATTDEEISLVREIVRTASLTCPVSRSTLGRRPVF